MGRPRTPTNVLEARGAFRRNPQRRRDGQPEVREPLGSPPESLSGASLVAWNEITRTAPIGVLTEADRLAVEACAHLVAEFRADPVAFHAAKVARMVALLGTFGMTPSDRAKISLPKSRERENPFAALDQ